MRIVKSVFALVALTASGVAFADPIVTVDFRDAAWDPADPSGGPSLATYTVGDVTANAHNGAGVLYQDAIDGLGIRGGENDEVDGDEWLEILIAAGHYAANELIDGVLLTDLFNAPDGGGGETGWVDVDPTNNVAVSTDHITVAWGTDYSDVRPIQGVIVGGGEHRMQVLVDVE